MNILKRSILFCLVLTLLGIITFSQSNLFMNPSLFAEEPVPDTEPPTPPVNLTQVGITDNSVDLCWEASTDNYWVQNYKIYDELTVIDSVYSSVYATVGGLLPDTEYRFTVKAEDAAGNLSEPSNELTVRTLLCAPQNITARLTDVSVNLSWDEVQGAQNYDVEIDGTIISDIADTNYVHRGFTPDTYHTYRIRAKSESNMGQWGEVVTFKTLKRTVVGGIISENTVWDNTDEVYLVQSNLTVSQDTYLQIDSGIIVKFNPNVSINVNGKVDVNGTLNDETVITSVRDSEYGGTGVLASGDYWGGLYIGNTGVFNASNASITYGGNYYYANNNRFVIVEGSIALNNCKVSNPYVQGIFINTNKDVEITESEISNSSSAAVNISSFGTGNMIIRGNNISKNAYAIYVGLNNLDSSIFSGISDNIFTDNVLNGVPVDGVYLSGTTKADLTLSGTQEYIIRGVTLGQGFVMNVEAGAVIRCNYFSDKLKIYGTLNAMGTNENPVVFTTSKDIVYSGTGISNYMDYWNGIYISPTGEFNGDNCIIRYGGCYTYEKAIEVNGKLNLVNSEIYNPSYTGIHIASDKDVTVENCIIKNAGNKGIYVDNTGVGNIAIKNNVIENAYFRGININQFGTGDLSIRNNTIRNSNTPIYINLSGLNSSIFHGISGNELIDNVYLQKQCNIIILEKAPKVDLLLSTNEYYFTGSMYVPQGINITIQPSTKLVFNNTASTIFVHGKLNAYGTEAEPIELKSFYEYVTGNNGGIWGGMYIYPEGEFYGDNVHIRNCYYYNASTSMIGVEGKLSLVNSVISDSYPWGIGIYFNTTIQPTLRFNTFRDNNWAIHNARSSEITIDARYNYWGSIYGPGYDDTYKHNSVSAGVDYSPYLGEEFKYKMHYGKSGVNSPTGNYSRTFNDLSLENPGADISIARTYNSKNEDESPFGRGWSFGYKGSVKDYDYVSSLKIVKLPNGSSDVYKAESDGTYTSLYSRNNLEKQPDGSFILTTKDQMRYGFNTDGYLVWVKDRNDNSVSMVVDTEGNVLKIIDHAGREILLTYENGYINTITDYAGRTVTYEYENNLLVRAVDPMGNLTRYTYDSMGYLSEVRDHNNNLVESIVYDHVDGDNKDKVYQKTDMYGNIKTYTYDNINGKTTITDSNRRQSVEWYDDNMFVITSKDAEQRLTTVEYFENSDGKNMYGEQRAVTDRNGNTTQYERDERGNITKITNPDGSFKTFKYDAKNNIIEEMDETGKYTFYIYDSEMNNLIKKVQPLNGTDIYVDGVDESNFAITTYTYYTDQESQQLGYGGYGLFKSVTNPEGDVVTYTYDFFGNIKTESDPETGLNRTYEYNSVGLKTAEITPKGYRTEYTYDSNGNMEKVALHDGETTRIVYDSRGKVIKEVSPNLYDPLADDLANHAYISDHGYIYTYYPSGEVYTIKDPEDYVTAYTYDLYGNVLSETRPNGTVYEFEYDVMNRISKKYFKESVVDTAVLLEENSYEILSDGKTWQSKTVHISDTVTATTTSKYDYAKRTVEIENADGNTLITSYNANGTVNSKTDEAGESIYYKYDGLNRLSEVWTPVEKDGATTLNSYRKITYDKAGRQKEVLIGKALVSLYSLPQSFFATNYDYYKNGNVKSITNGAGRRNDYQYDDDGNVTVEDITINSTDKQTTEYLNNHLGKPVQVTEHVRAGDIYGNDFASNDYILLTTSYTYDANGNIKTVTAPNGITTTYDYDNVDRQVSASTPGQDEYGSLVTIRNETSYDSEGNMISQQDALGNTTSYSYSQRGFLQKVTDAKGGITSYYYDRAGRMTAEVSPLNYIEGYLLEQLNRTEYTYDLLGRLLTKEESYYDVSAAAWKSFVSKAYEYDTKGNLTKEMDALGYANGYGTEYKYNLADKVIEVLDPVSKDRGLLFSQKYTYDARGRKKTETDAKGAVITYYYDEADNVTSITVKKSESDPEKIIEQNAYNLRGDLTSKTDGNRNLTIYEYNLLGLVRSETHPGDMSIPSNTVSYQYDSMGNVVSIKDLTDKVELYTYDNQGRQLSLTAQDKSGQQSVTNHVYYDKAGNIRFEIDGRGVITESTYDEVNRLKSVSTSGKTTTYEYDENGNMTKETNWRGNEFVNEYDPLNRLVRKIDPNQKTIETIAYNKNHVQVSSVDALGNKTLYTYDKNNRLLDETDPLGNAKSRTYDDVGNVASKTDGENNTATYEYDEFSNLVLVKNAKNETTSYTYDLNGNMLAQTDGKDNTTTYEYNCANLVEKRQDPNGVGISSKTESYTYYADTSLKSKTDRNGNITTYEYDVHGNLISESVGAITNTYTYDQNGNKLTMTDSTGTTTRVYDDFGRVVSKTVPDIGTSVYEYDIIDGIEAGCTGERTTDPKGNVTFKVYDKSKRLWKVISDGQTTTYEYYDNGACKSVLYPDGSREEYTYHANNLLWTLTNKKSDLTVMDTYTYTYDGAGNQISKNEVIDNQVKGTTIFTYDSLKRLETVSEPEGMLTSYSYDKAGNRIGETVAGSVYNVDKIYVYNEQNRLVSITVNTDGLDTEEINFIYDNNGNQTTVSSSVYGTTVYIYDSFNMLAATTTSIVGGRNPLSCIYSVYSFKTGKKHLESVIPLRYALGYMVYPGCNHQSAGRLF